MGSLESQVELTDKMSQIMFTTQNIRNFSIDPDPNFDPKSIKPKTRGIKIQTKRQNVVDSSTSPIQHKSISTDTSDIKEKFYQFQEQQNKKAAQWSENGQSDYLTLLPA